MRQKRRERDDYEYLTRPVALPELSPGSRVCREGRAIFGAIIEGGLPLRMIRRFAGNAISLSANRPRASRGPLNPNDGA